MFGGPALVFFKEKYYLAAIIDGAIEIAILYFFVPRLFPFLLDILGLCYRCTGW